MMLKKYVGKAVSRIVKDFKQKELIPLKILFFVQATTIAVLYPYLTIHMRELGISIEETAIMSAMIPVIGILMPPLAGMVADKIGNFKVLLSWSSLIGGLTALLLLFVPPARIRAEYPQQMVFDFGCARESGLPNMMPSDFNQCDMISTNKTSNELNMRLETCGLACQAINQTLSASARVPTGDEDALDMILKAKIYSVKFMSNNETRFSTYNLTNADGDHFESIRRVSGGDFFFFPSRGSYQLRCKQVPSFAGSPQLSTVCYIAEEASELSADEIREKTESPAAEFLRDRTVTLSFGDNSTFPNFESSACFDPRKEEVATVSIYLDDLMTDVIELSKCEARCLMTVGRKEICSNANEDITQDPNLTFWIYFVVRVLIGITGSTTYSMFEVAVIAILREHKADYGLQRIYASIGGMVASPLSGFLIDYASRGKLGTDYSPAFYLYGALKILSSVLILFINLEFKTAAKSVISDFIQVMKNAEVLCLLASCFVLGSAWGYIESFLFWFLEDLGGNRSLMGITVTVGGLAGIPLLILSGPIVDKIGHANVIFIGFIFYAIRLLGYSLIYNPYHCLFFEAMESITSSLAITAAITYAAKLSTTTTDGSIQGLVGGLYYGVGKGAGTLIGGYLMKSYGTRETFQIFSVFTIGTGIIYFLINQCYIRKLPNRENNEICKKEPGKPKVEDDVKIITEKAKESEGKTDGDKRGVENAATQNAKEEDNEGYVRTEADEAPGEAEKEPTQPARTKAD